MPLALVALAIGAFGIGLTEFVIMGLLPQVAADFGVTEAAAGWLITGYALSVVVGALALTAAAARLPRKPVLLGLLVLFIAGNIVTAVAPDYSIAMIGRALAALCHGAFFGIGAVVAAGLVAPAKRAGAIAVMFTGFTAANVLGVPFGTFLGQQAGWRSTFWAIAVIGVVALLGILTLVPAVKSPDERVSLRGELRAFRSGQVWLSLSLTVLAWGGMFGAFTYIAYTLTEVGGFPSAAVPWLLVLFGVGLVIGNGVGGKLADRSLDGTIIGFAAALLVVLALFALFASSQVATLIALPLIGGFGFGTVPGLQTRTMSSAGGAPTLASGANIAAFNVGNALGAWLGGIGLTLGLGYTSPVWIGAAITAVALTVAILARRTARRAPHPLVAEAAGAAPTASPAPTRIRETASSARDHG